jgi:AcrR family transcriptional regulator
VDWVEAKLSVDEPKRQRNQRGEGGKLRDEVIEAAMRILDRSPATELSLRMVAREAGVAAPSLYRQFDDADAMMKAVVRECWTQVAEAMAVAGGLNSQMAPLAQLQAQMGAYVQYAMQRPSRYQLLFALPVGWELELDGPLRPAYRVVYESIERHAQAGGNLPTGDVVSAALLTISFAHGRIALAHLAPARAGNLSPELQSFVCETIGRLFT